MTRGAIRRRRQRGSRKPRTFSRWEYDAAPRTFSKKSCSLRAARPLEKALQWPNCASGTHRSARSQAAVPVPQPSDPAAPFLQTRPSLQRLRPRWPHTRLRQRSRHSLVRTRFFPPAGSALISRLARVRARRRQSPESSFEIRHPLRRLFRTIDGPFERVNFSPLHAVCGILRAAYHRETLQSAGSTEPALRLSIGHSLFERPVTARDSALYTRQSSSALLLSTGGAATC